MQFYEAGLVFFISRSLKFPLVCIRAQESSARHCLSTRAAGSKTKFGKIPKTKHAAAIKVQMLRVIGVRGVPESVLLK